MNNIKKGFTIIELVIVIAVIAILSSVIAPKVAEFFNESKDKIVDIYNGEDLYVYSNETKELLYEGKEIPFEYELVSVSYNNGKVILYVNVVNEGGV